MLCNTTTIFSPLAETQNLVVCNNETIMHHLFVQGNSKSSDQVRAFTFTCMQHSSIKQQQQHSNHIKKNSNTLQYANVATSLIRSQQITVHKSEMCNLQYTRHTATVIYTRVQYTGTAVDVNRQPHYTQYYSAISICTSH